MGLVTLLIILIVTLALTRLFSDNQLPNENLDLILAFGATIVTGVLMYVTKKQNDKDS
jgi:hypothetical protein